MPPVVIEDANYIASAAAPHRPPLSFAGRVGSSEYITGMGSLSCC